MTSGQARSRSSARSAARSASSTASKERTTPYIKFVSEGRPEGLFHVEHLGRNRAVAAGAVGRWVDAREGRVVDVPRETTFHVEHPRRLRSPWNVQQRESRLDLDLDEHTPALPVELRRAAELHSRNRQDEDPPPGRNQLPAKRQPGRRLEGSPGRSLHRTARRLRQLFAAAAIEADPVTQAQLSDGSA